MSGEVDLGYLNDILVNRMQVKRQPVAITYCADAPPAGYQPVNVPACAVVRQAELGQRVYVDAVHHDCWVGQYHLGWHPQADSFITEGEYLTMEQGFFTPEGARRNKAQSFSLPAAAIKALAAAPLHLVPDGVAVDLLICICNPQQAMQIAGAASVREGTFPHGEIGPSACSSLFAAPWHTRNSVFTTGEGGGRSFNALDATEMFVAIPSAHFHCIIELVENFRFDRSRARERLMPSHAPKSISE